LIFIILGSQKFEFNRLLEEIDDLIEMGIFKDEEIVAQTGHSTYKPKHFKTIAFLEKDQFLEKIKQSDLVITHGGASAIISSLKYGKKIIGVARNQQYAEHIDNHQVEIIENFASKRYIIGVCDLSELQAAINLLPSYSFSDYNFNNDRLISVVRNELKSFGKKKTVLNRLFGGG